MKIGEKIKKLREKLGYTQEQLAELMGYKSKSTINKIEAGINDITQSKVIEFAKILKTTPAYLMCWDDNPTSLKPTVDTSMLTEAELAEFEKITGVNQQLFFNGVENDHDMDVFKEAVLNIILSNRKKEQK